MDVEAIPDLVKHVLTHYKALLDGMEAYDPDAWYYPADSNTRNLSETIAAIRDVPNSWLPAFREPYLQTHRRTLCRAFAQYVLDLKKMLGEEWKAVDAQLKGYYAKQGWKWREPVRESPDVEPNLERQLRAEIESASKLGHEFCEPYTAPYTLPNGRIDSAKWLKWATRDWATREGRKDED